MLLVASLRCVLQRLLHVEAAVAHVCNERIHA